MYATVASVALGYATLWSTAAACQYTEQPSAVLNAIDALRVPIASAGAAAQNECAATAQAFGLSTVSIVPGEAGAGSQCVLFEEQASTSCGPTYEALSGALTLWNITECDATNMKAISDAALPLEGAGAMGTVGTSTTAVKVMNTAAVGQAVHSDLSFVTEEECVVACASYIEDCTHVTAVVAQGQMVKCSFHGSPTQGVQYQGANTYYSIVPNPELAARSLGATSAQLGGTPEPAAVAAPPTGAAVAPVVATEPEIVALAPAPATGAQPADAMEELLYTPPGTCPGETITDVPVGKHEDTLEPPEEVLAKYSDVVGDDGTFAMPYDELINGGAYCVDKGSTATTFLVGGTFLWDAGDGECVAPPTTDAGESCCEVFMWQPNNLGFYYENCSMKMQIAPNGIYYFETEMPGDESLNGWGPDPEAHIHFDILCSGCGEHAVVDGEYHYWNKFYPEDLCMKTSCGDQGPEHQATLTSVGGQTLYKYDFVLPPTTRTQNSA